MNLNNKNCTNDDYGLLAESASQESIKKRGTPYNRSKDCIQDDNSNSCTVHKKTRTVSFKKCTRHSGKRKQPRVQDERAPFEEDRNNTDETTTPLSRNPFINFLRDCRRINKEKLANMTQVEIVKICAENWRKLSEEAKRFYQNKAARAPRKRSRRRSSSRTRRSRSKRSRSGCSRRNKTREASK